MHSKIFAFFTVRWFSHGQFMCFFPDMIFSLGFEFITFQAALTNACLTISHEFFFCYLIQTYLSMDFDGSSCWASVFMLGLLLYKNILFFGFMHYCATVWENICLEVLLFCSLLTFDFMTFPPLLWLLKFFVVFPKMFLTGWVARLIGQL